MGTLSKWFHIYEIKTDHKKPKRATLKTIGSVKHKRCYGPNHNGDWVPINKFRKHAGKPFGINPRCKRCENPSAWVDFTFSYKAWVTSIVRRLGFSETCRRLKISQRTLSQWQKDPPRRLRRENAESIVRVLAELRASNEVRHRKSIRRGAAARGEPERKVTSASHLYNRSDGDAGTEYKRRHRAREKLQESSTGLD